MENLIIALITFHSAANLTCIFAFKGYPDGVSKPFRNLNIIILISILVLIGLDSPDKQNLLTYILDNYLPYGAYLTIVQYFCFHLDYVIRKINRAKGVGE